MQSHVRRYRILWLVLAASLAFNAGVGATVGVRAFNKYTADTLKGEPPRRPRGPRMWRELNLTEEQRAGLRDARRELRQRHRRLRETVRAETDALVDLLTAAEPDREAIDVQLNKLGAFRSQMDRDMVEHLLSIRATLQPAQYEAFDRVIRHTLHRGGHGHHGPGSPRGRFPGSGRERDDRRHRRDDRPRPPFLEETD